MFRTFFTVVGHGAFPIDMLRYDRCCPQEQVDVNAIGDSLDPDARSDHRRCTICKTPLRDHRADSFDHAPKREDVPFVVKLVSYHANKSDPFTRARWMSFGWDVVTTPTWRTEKAT